MAKKLFYVFGEIRIEDGGSAGFLFVGFGQCDALGDAAAHWIGGVKHCYGTLAVLDDDLGAGADASQQRGKVAGRFSLGDVNDMLSHRKVIHR